MVDISEVNKPIMILPRLVYLHPGGSRAHFSEGRINDGCLDTCGEAIIARSRAGPSPLLLPPRASVDQVYGYAPLFDCDYDLEGAIQCLFDTEKGTRN